MTRKCKGACGVECNADITAMSVQTQRCFVCHRNHVNARTRALRARKRLELCQDLAQVTFETEAELTLAIVEKVRSDWSTSQMTEYFGITAKKLRNLHCAHYQRRVGVAA